MKIAITGIGYVGLSNAMLLAQCNEVVALDIIPEKIEQLNNKISPIADTEIEDFLANKNLNFVATLDKEFAYKNADFIILNYANESGSGFESNTNRVKIFSKSGNEKELKKDRKDRIAKRIFDFIILDKNR